MTRMLLPVCCIWQHSHFIFDRSEVQEEEEPEKPIVEGRKKKFVPFMGKKPAPKQVIESDDDDEM